MQGRADCVSLIGPAFVDGASSISAELVRQRRRANNSCGYKRRSIESSHRVASFRYFLRPFDLNWNVNIGLAVLPIQQGFTLWTPRRRDERPRRGEERGMYALCGAKSPAIGIKALLSTPQRRKTTSNWKLRATDSSSAGQNHQYMGAPHHPQPLSGAKPPVAGSSTPLTNTQ